MNNQGAVISEAIANLTARALTKKYPNAKIKSIKNLQAGPKTCFDMFVFSAKADIPEATRKKIEFFFLYEIKTKDEKHSIPVSFVMNFDQTTLKLVPCGKNPLAKQNSNLVTIAGASDKPSITRAFAIRVRVIFFPCD